MIFITLGLLITLIIGIATGYLSTVFIFPVIAKIKTKFGNETKENPFGENYHYDKIDKTMTILSSLFCITIIIFILAIIFGHQDLNQKTLIIKLILSFALGGLCLGYGIHIHPQMADGSVLPLQKSKSNIIMICAAFITPMVIGSPSMIIQFPFSYFGISDHNATVSIDTESWKKIEYVAQLSKIEPDACLNGKDLVILKNAEILWSKIGNQALLRVFGKDKRHDTAFIEIELPSKKVFPIKVGNTQIDCSLKNPQKQNPGPIT
ncbi:hypothetical protein [Thalassospira lucentensis]|uniref:hypothetical protein n=1 Tax=Thalassospira lucentensis TaxID=168935 RepID=UPI002943A93A|nr:hypothetical protein [Thalassospira lucentensis]WOI10806.1 hypothetical protein R1T41_20135 [Thalassospira lucentensis]